MPTNSNTEIISQEVRRLVREADMEKDPRDKPVCSREFYARAFGVLAGALLVKGISPAGYQRIYSEVQDAFCEFQSPK